MAYNIEKDLEMENYFPNQNQQKSEMSIKDWLITLFITSIPLVGFIFLIKWALGDDNNITRKNFSKAALLLMIIVYGLIFIFYFTILTAALATIGKGL